MSCCGGHCGCGAGCGCGKACGGCKMFPDMTENNSRETLVLGVAAVSKENLDGSEMCDGAENGCKCGDNCTCDPCNCK